MLKGYCNQNGVDLGQSVDGGPNTDDSTTNYNDHVYGNIRWRHNGNKAANFLYVDGHAGTLRYNSEMHTGLLRRNVCVDMP
jgi:prepilin-type processing-associated H-X9-DG protein